MGNWIHFGGKLDSLWDTLLPKIRITLKKALSKCCSKVNFVQKSPCVHKSSMQREFESKHILYTFVCILYPRLSAYRGILQNHIIRFPCALILLFLPSRLPIKYEYWLFPPYFLLFKVALIRVKWKHIFKNVFLTNFWILSIFLVLCVNKICWFQP